MHMTRYTCPCGNEGEFQLEGQVAYWQRFTQLPDGGVEYEAHETYDTTWDQAVICVPCGKVVEVLGEEVRIPWETPVGEKYKI